MMAETSSHVTPLDRPYTLEGKRVWVAGHRGMVGGACVRRLQEENCTILTAGREAADLRRQKEVEDYLADARPHAIILAAATVGGIHANDTRPAEFIYDNLVIETNIVEAARLVGVEKLLFLGSSCIYPKHADQPMSEDALLTGPLEPTNEWYAVAKIAGIKLCQAYRRQYGCDFISAMPTNLYGPGDNFDRTQSHVIPGLIRRFHEAKENGDTKVAVWGSGRPRREFLHVEDLADALVHLLKVWSGESHINVGVGEDLPISELAQLVAKVVGFQGELEFDPSMPDGTPRKLLDTSRLQALGWQPSVSLEQGLATTYAWFLEHLSEARTGAA